MGRLSLNHERACAGGEGGLRVARRRSLRVAPASRVPQARGRTGARLLHARCTQACVIVIAGRSTHTPRASGASHRSAPSVTSAAVASCLAAFALLAAVSYRPPRGTRGSR